MANNDHFAKVNPGQPIAGLLSARRENATTDGARLARNHRLSYDTPPGSAELLDPAVIWVKNTSPGTLYAGNCVELVEPLIKPEDNLPEFGRRVLYKGQAPTAAALRFGVMLEPVPAGGIGRCAVAGLVPALVFANSASDKFVAKQTGQVHLFSGTSGPAALDWPDNYQVADDTGALSPGPVSTTTGLMWCMVYLGGGGAAGGGLTGSYTVATSVTCSGGTLLVTYETWTFSNGDLTSVT